MSSPVYDVVIIGAGPVGMVTSLLLAAVGRRVLLLERDERPHRHPRAAVLDDQAMRTLAAIGVADRVLPFLSPQRVIEWVAPTGEVVVRHHLAERGRSGWPASSTVFQPDLDAALETACDRADGLELRRGSTVIGLAQSPASVEVRSIGLHGPETVTASYAIACDGGESGVRSALGIGEDDHGFTESWLMCDLRLRGDVELSADRQVADPDGPWAGLELGNRHYRFGFLVDSDADSDALTTPEHVWSRVGAFIDPDDGELVRTHVHRFHARIAQRWRVGRILLAGEAAHRLPRHYEQGLNAGLHDAHNLAVKLDLVLAGTHPDELLDSYQLEREPAVTTVLRSAVTAGRAFSLRSHADAAGRDRQVRAEVEADRAPGLGDRPILSGQLFADRSHAGSGELSAHGMVDDGDRRVRLDQLLGPGFTVVVDAAILPDFDRSPAAGSLVDAGVHVVMLDADVAAPGVHAVIDVEGVYGRWLTSRGWSAVAIRPDYYVYGAATGTGSAPAAALADELLASIGS